MKRTEKELIALKAFPISQKDFFKTRLTFRDSVGNDKERTGEGYVCHRWAGSGFQDR